MAKAPRWEPAYCEFFEARQHSLLRGRTLRTAVPGARAHTAFAGSADVSQARSLTISTRSATESTTRVGR